MSVPDMLAPPDDATVDRAIRDFARAVRAAYGDRVKGIYLFGSRARGDHGPDSDADVAVVLAGDGFDFWAEKLRLADLAHDIVMDSGAHVQGWPVHERDWEVPTHYEDSTLIREIHRDAQPIEIVE